MLRYTPKQSTEKWCRVSYKVTVVDGGEEFDCECGQFTHMGLLCSHVLKVLDFIRIKEIPRRHIVKRWTRDVRDILPAHLTHYQKDHAHKNPFSFRHFMMYMHAMELVRMGDTSVEAYEHLVSLFKNCMVEMQPYAEIRDGLGLEDRIAENGDDLNHNHPEAALVVAGDRATSGLANDDSNSANESGNRLARLLPPAKRKEMGRPTTSREKAPYEGLSKRTRFCTICWRQGHKRTTCPDRWDVPKQARRLVRCKNCGVEGHRRNNCTKAPELRLNSN